MLKYPLINVVFPVFLLFSLQAYAVPYGAMDPRSLAMGGVGVASGGSAHAGLLNPALLAVPQANERFALELPMAYLRVADPDELRDELDAYQDNDVEGDLTRAVDAFTRGIPTMQEAQAVAAAADTLLKQLDAMSGKILEGEFFGGLSVAIPSNSVGASLFVGARVVGSGLLKLDQQDIDMVEEIVKDANSGVSDLLANPDINDQLTGTEDIVQKLKSALNARGAALFEMGVSLAREFRLAGQSFSVGVTPKYVQVTTFDYEVDVQEAEDIDVDEGQKKYNSFNLDVGLAKSFGNGWKAGFAVKNVITQDYETAQNNIVTIAPQARVGVSHSREWWTLAVDADLNAADPVGFEGETQYLGVGAEFDIFDMAQVRLGYRHNLKSSDASMPTIGFGLSPFGVHLDVAVGANENDIAVAGQLGFRF